MEPARIKEAIDGSVDGGADTMNLWLGHDGFEYSFQGHYQDAWSWLMEGLAKIAEYNRSEMPVCIEPEISLHGMRLPNQGSLPMELVQSRLEHIEDPAYKAYIQLLIS